MFYQYGHYCHIYYAVPTAIIHERNLEYENIA